MTKIYEFQNHMFFVYNNVVNIANFTNNMATSERERVTE